MTTTCPSPTFSLDHVAFLTSRPLVDAHRKSIKSWFTSKAFVVASNVSCLQRRQRSVAKAFHSAELRSWLDCDDNCGNNNNNNNNNGGNGNHGEDGNEGEFFQRQSWFSLLSVLGLVFRFHLETESALAKISGKESLEDEKETVWEIRGSRWTKFIADHWTDQFVPVGSSLSSSLGVGNGDFKYFSVDFCPLWSQCKDLFMRLMLPEGFPDSVTNDYLDYSLWRGVQGIASQINGVIATQSLLYAVGLGKGAIPTAAAINWVLKDGIGYLSKIILSNFGRHFDVNPKGWRLFADLLENTALGMEMLTPAFPHLFVFIGATAGAGRSAAILIQAATRSCFYAGFAARRNFAEVIAKGEAQGMVSKFIGIMLGIGLANCIGSSSILALTSFGVVTWVHMFCNLKSYQSIQLRTLNPYRASLIFSEYLMSGQVPPVKDVNDEEPFFPAVPFLSTRLVHKLNSTNLTLEAKTAAAEIERRLMMGSRLSNVIHNREDAAALLKLFNSEGYILTENKGKFCVILKENASPLDMLKSLFHVNYLFWLENHAGIMFGGAADECRLGGKLQISLDYVQREFEHWKADSGLAGWITDGLITRPLPCRISVDNDSFAHGS